MDKVFGADKQKNLIFALTFALLWAGLAVWNVLTPEEAFSQAENRYLASFPHYSAKRLLDGDYMNDMNTYLNDQFVGRPYWVGAQSLAEYALGKREINEIYMGSNTLFRHYPAENSVISEQNAAGINAFAARYKIPTAVMLVPSSTYIQRDQLPFLAPAWDEAAYIQSVYKTLSEDVAAIDLCEDLSGDHDQAVYYRTDHHWTSYGAYLGYLRLVDALSLPSTARTLRITTLSEEFLGTYHSRVGFPLTDPEPLVLYEMGSVSRFVTDGAQVIEERDSIYYPEYLEQKDKYAYFLGQAQPYVTIHTNADSDKRLIIFKDSYANCLTPMLLADYKEIRLVTMSFFAEDYGEYVDVGRYDEALFLYSTSTFSQQLAAGKFSQS